VLFAQGPRCLCGALVLWRIHHLAGHGPAQHLIVIDGHFSDVGVGLGPRLAALGVAQVLAGVDVEADVLADDRALAVPQHLPVARGGNPGDGRSVWKPQGGNPGGEPW
jgi:hypothetical protein